MKREKGKLKKANFHMFFLFLFSLQLSHIFFLKEKKRTTINKNKKKCPKKKERKQSFSGHKISHIKTKMFVYVRKGRELELKMMSCTTSNYEISMA